MFCIVLCPVGASPTLVSQLLNVFVFAKKNFKKRNENKKMNHRVRKNNNLRFSVLQHQSKKIDENLLS